MINYKILKSKKTLDGSMVNKTVNLNKKRLIVYKKN